jgi:hypothetical protein
MPDSEFATLLHSPLCRDLPEELRAIPGNIELLSSKCKAESGPAGSCKRGRGSRSGTTCTVSTAALEKTRRAQIAATEVDIMLNFPKTTFVQTYDLIILFSFPP